ncbi:flavohemoprotein b5/b5r, putative [Perkinsus marinus ATCC 50983]|uniref:Flavohemoprotein b5/b5r, putative n=1 Tax=Perkinsus marinus (strain ATCC 50983 / TXsc) TaxID=423536 RepID=C5LIU3_PERM5|nr:flavohemoprotein b5/b5r, putative [Perkinsus marinus ATCC 50983]EER03496.1 flavohemoprotein b5/b5r, putative [Perkinsus marinus ATCC 50983]|eukprot:XP_002771680.1 flavohemoprotein b5/b5r, putative [Perkinsus marinus ATCC 50983]
MSDPPEVPAAPSRPLPSADLQPHPARHSHSSHVSFADRVKKEIERGQRTSTTSTNASGCNKLQTPAVPHLPPRKKVKSKNQFAYMRIMADNKPLLFPADKLTWDEVAHHNSKHDCWTVINGVVYDITSYLDYHPGGRGELFQGAGKDCTNLFNIYHPWVSEEAILRNARLGPVIGGPCPPHMVAERRGELQHRPATGQEGMRPGGDPTKIVSVPLPTIPEYVPPTTPSPILSANDAQSDVPVAAMLRRSKPKTEAAKTNEVNTEAASRSQPSWIPLLFRGSVFFPGMKLFPPHEHK